MGKEKERLRVGSLNPEYRALQKMFLSSKLDFVLRMLKRGYIILMYHSTPVSASWVYDVGKNYFKEQIEYVSNNYNVLSISSIVERMRRGEKLNKTIFGITFDDGYENNYKVAYPLLVKYDIPATIFPCTLYITEDGSYKSTIGEQMLSWPEIEEMEKSGLITVGSHSHTHPNLTSISKEEVINEIETSKRIFQDKLSVEVELFSVPGGYINDDVKEIIKSRGFKAILTSKSSINPANQSPYDIGRMCIRIRNQELPSFAFKILGIEDKISKITGM